MIVSMKKLADSAAEERFRTALGLYSAGVDLQRQRLRRTFPDESSAEIELRLQRWLLREGEPGDCVGRTVQLPREDK